MNTTYHLKSAQEIDTDFLESVKSLYKSKPITIFIEEDNLNSGEISDTIKSVLEERMLEDESTCLTASETLGHLKTKYGI